MYVDKLLSDVKAVQTLSRLNRAHPQKHDTFVLDFMNDAEIIQTAFERYYRTTILSEASDPNKLHDLKADLDGYQVYTDEEVALLVGVLRPTPPKGTVGFFLIRLIRILLES
jgi:type I restriction enzyme R subunit